MSRVLEDEVNVLCVGDVLSGKTAFLSSYTHSQQQQLHYRVYPLQDSSSTVVFLHQIQEREGMDTYLSYPFDGVLYFLNINDYHNPYSAILEQLAMISKHSGLNIYSIPLRVIVLSAKKQPYLSLTQSSKRRFLKQIQGFLLPSNVIFVEDNQKFKQQLSFFYNSLRNEEVMVMGGILESAYVNWYLKGVIGFFPLQSLLLNIKKVCQLAHRQYLKIRKRFEKTYWYKQI